MGKLLYRVLFRDETSPRLWGFETASAAHDWARRRHPGRDYVVRTEPVNPLEYLLMRRPTKERLCRPPSPIAAVVIALIVMAGLAGAVSGRSDDVPFRESSTILPGAVAQCRDGTYSDNTEFWNTCRSAHGVRRWLAPKVLCRDGRILELDENASCGTLGVDRLVT